MNALLNGLAEEKVVLCKTPLRLPFALEGIVRLIDKSGRTLGLVLSADALRDIAEDSEASDPKFLASLNESRRSGRVSSSAVKKRLGLK